MTTLTLQDTHLLMMPQRRRLVLGVRHSSQVEMDDLFGHLPSAGRLIRSIEFSNDYDPIAAMPVPPNSAGVKYIVKGNFTITLIGHLKLLMNGSSGGDTIFFALMPLFWDGMRCATKCNMDDIKEDCGLCRPSAWWKLHDRSDMEDLDEDNEEANMIRLRVKTWSINCLHWADAPQRWNTDDCEVSRRL